MGGVRSRCSEATVCRHRVALFQTEFTRSALGSVPVGGIALTLDVLAIAWVSHSPSLSGSLRAAIIGGIFAFATALAFNVMLRGVVFRPCKIEFRPDAPAGHLPSLHYAKRPHELRR